MKKELNKINYNKNEFLKCEPILYSKANICLVKDFKIDRSTGFGLQRYINEKAVEDEIEHINRTYLIKDIDSNEIVAYFSLKAGAISTKEEIQPDGSIEFDSIPGIEISNFAVNDLYKNAHPETKGVGVIIFYDFILPLCKMIAKLVGAKLLYIFSLPYDSLINHYHNEMNFSRLSKELEDYIHNKYKPSYDAGCVFMSRSIFTINEKEQLYKPRADLVLN